VGPVFANLDQWDGYPTERAHILSTLRDAGVTNFVALTGDLHTFTAGYLKTDYNDLFERPMGVEFMVGSVSSANLEDQIRSGLNLPSAPMPAERLGLPANKLAPAVRLANPHIHYWNSAAHGYGVLDIDDTAMTCRYMAVDTIAAPDSGVRELKTLRVNNGQVWLHDV
ncbi:alkaline phosphatase D family protein, partial [uncultured Salinisphaera sp.]|uniref:alkaline phosphatase D family protein n=1 Tax=uncultured Salinisphaera sp. TaxID=359372 RepID=UPI0032B166D2